MSTSNSRAVSSLRSSKWVSKVNLSFLKPASISDIMALRAAVSRDWNSSSSLSDQSVFLESYCCSSCSLSSFSRS